MALIQRGISRRTKILAGALIVTLLAGGGYLFIQNQPDDLGFPLDGTLVQRRTGDPVIKEFSDELYTDPRFTALQFTEPIEIEIGAMGKSNPFLETF